MLKPLAMAHTVALSISIYLYFATLGAPALSSVILQVSFVYVFFVVFWTRHRHYLPALTLLFVTKLIEYPISNYFFGQGQLVSYLGCIVGFDLLLAATLYKYHQADFFNKVFSISTPVRVGGIRQVNALILVLCLSALQGAAIVVEVLLFRGGYITSEQLWLYPAFQPMKVVIKLMEALAVWSMLIDAVYEPENKAVRLLLKIQKSIKRHSN